MWCDSQSNSPELLISNKLKRKLDFFFKLLNMKKKYCNNLSPIHRRLILTLALAVKLDPVIPLPTQCRQIEVLSS
jgi:hypothetical protein